MWRLGIILIGLIVLIGVSEGVISAETQLSTTTVRWVDPTIGSDAAGNGCTASETPCLTIDRAVQIASDDDIIYVRPGSYAEDIVVWLDDNLTIAAVDANDLVCSGGTVCATLDSFRLTGQQSAEVSGFAFAGGDEILLRVESSNLTLKSCRIENHRQGHPANPPVKSAILVSGTALIEDCYFANNESSTSGGVISNSGRVVVFNSTFENNETDDSGGAIFSTGDGELAVADSSFRSNSAANDGGAIMGNFTLTNVTLQDNTAGNHGGAIAIDPISYVEDMSTIRNSFVLSNTASVGGGGIYIEGGASLSVDNTMLINNQAFSAERAVAQGGSLYFFRSGFRFTKARFVTTWRQKMAVQSGCIQAVRD